MIVRVIILALAIFLLLNLISFIKRQPPQQRKALIWKYSGFGILAIAVILVATGRLHWIGAAVAAVLPFLRNIGTTALRFMPFLNWVRQQRFANPVLNSQFIRLVINISNGTMDGEVLAGRHQGSPLGNLSEEQLRELLREYQQQDVKSARLLSVYMARRFQQQQYSQSSAADSGPMTRSEALQILGVKEGATRQDIVKAHRSLIQKVHPDRGGSDYLAAKINQAKDFLLKT